jgi:hypothetical protein
MESSLMSMETVKSFIPSQRFFSFCRISLGDEWKIAKRSVRLFVYATMNRLIEFFSSIASSLARFDFSHKNEFLHSFQDEQKKCSIVSVSSHSTHEASSSYYKKP